MFSQMEKLQERVVSLAEENSILRQEAAMTNARLSLLTAHMQRVRELVNQAEVFETTAVPSGAQAMRSQGE